MYIEIMWLKIPTRYLCRLAYRCYGVSFYEIINA